MWLLVLPRGAEPALARAQARGTEGCTSHGVGSRDSASPFWLSTPATHTAGPPPGSPGSSSPPEPSPGLSQRQAVAEAVWEGLDGSQWQLWGLPQGSALGGVGAELLGRARLCQTQVRAAPKTDWGIL